MRTQIEQSIRSDSSKAHMTDLDESSVNAASTVTLEQNVHRVSNAGEPTWAILNQLSNLQLGVQKADSTLTRLDRRRLSQSLDRPLFGCTTNLSLIRTYKVIDSRLREELRPFLGPYPYKPTSTFERQRAVPTDPSGLHRRKRQISAITSSSNQDGKKAAVATWSSRGFEYRLKGNHSTIKCEGGYSAPGIWICSCSSQRRPCDPCLASGKKGRQVSRKDEGISGGSSCKVDLSEQRQSAVSGRSKEKLVRMVRCSRLRITDAGVGSMFSTIRMGAPVINSVPVQDAIRESVDALLALSRRSGRSGTIRMVYLT